MAPEDDGRSNQVQILEELSAQLTIRLTVAVPDWVKRCVERGLLKATGRLDLHWTITDEAADALMRAAETAGWAAADDISGKLWRLLAGGAGERPSTTGSILALVQQLTAYPNAVLRAAGVPAAQRDRSAITRFPHDTYDIVPTSLAALHPLLPEMVWAWEAARAQGADPALPARRVTRAIVN